ncbi:uncharacterized protein LOC110174777 [Boleophthalmus pectinirostris]|uniref:uncharacterized protein LOC110174777 n=1 Tax=Boleophthalmus pectinirostris TaxID=150288 RepID=UPI00242F466B|nr:uncharacterized protein LOC110174777 [Boleophthalmus pectinirostris]
MSASSEKLEKALSEYFRHTFSFIETVRNFTTTSSEWIRQREEEKSTLANISEKARDVRNRFNQVKKAKQRAKAFGTFVGDSIVPGRASKKQAELEKELETELEVLLQRILEGLREMQIFLDAVEKLAVTSDRVFEKTLVVRLSIKTDLESVKRIILAARIIGPLVLLFKRNNEEFFKTQLHNVEVMQIQLDQYIGTIKDICSLFEECSVADLVLKSPTVFLDLDVREHDAGKMLERINTRSQIRMDEHLRMVFLFRDEHGTFMEMFRERRERMLEVLDELEPCAVKLDRMNKGARVSNVVGSSVGVVGGGLAIAGLALAPFTAGLSLGLTVAGAATAVTSGANGIVTMVTEKVVTSKQKEKANEVFKRFMKDVDELQNCVKEAINQHFQSTENSDLLKALKETGKGAAGMKSIDAIFDCSAVVKLWKAEKAVVKVAGSGRAVSKAASDVPELGQAALKGPLAMSKAARGGFIIVNALFIGLDVFVIANEGMSLSRGSETETSKWIRARAALWRSEVNSFQRINDSLEEGQELSEKKKVLQEPFYEGDVMDKTGQKGN